MLKYLFLLLPLWSAGQITSYTAAQTGAGNAEVWQTPGATGPLHVVLFFTGRGEWGTDKNKIYINGPFKYIKEGRGSELPTAIYIGCQSPVESPSVAVAQKFVDWALATFKPSAFSLTGLSYGGGNVDLYMRKTTDAAFKKPYAVVPMSVVMDASCGDFYKGTDSLCKTDLRYEGVKSWGICGRSDSYHDKQKRFFDRMLAKKYPARWLTIASRGHCCWNTEYNPSWKDADGMSIYRFMVPTETAPPITISAGPDITITFPVDSAIIRVTGVPEGANVYAKKDSGAGVLEGMILKNLYKGTAKVTVYVEYQGRIYTDQLYVTALYDPYATLTVLDIGDATDPKKRLKLAIDVSGRLSWLLQ